LSCPQFSRPGRQRQRHPALWEPFWCLALIPFLRVQYRSNYWNLCSGKGVCPWRASGPFLSHRDSGCCLLDKLMKLYSFVTRRGFQIMLASFASWFLNPNVPTVDRRGLYTHQADITSSAPIASAFKFRIASENREEENPAANSSGPNQHLFLPARRCRLHRCRPTLNVRNAVSFGPEFCRLTSWS
jgi:hypothetical protein